MKSNKLWNRKYGKYVETFSKIPSDFIRQKESVYFTVNGEVKFSKSFKPLPTTDVYGSVPIIMLKDTDKDYNKYLKVAEAYEEWKEEYTSLKREANAILESVNTTGQLLEVWEDVEPFLPAFVASPNKGINLPALQISRLNEKLGIKK